MTRSFAHLHVHTEYSMLDGMAKHGLLMAEANRLGMPAVAMTDHGNLFGAYSFFQAAKAACVKPIIGIEAYVAPGDRFHKGPVFWGHPGQRDDDVSAGGAYTHLTLLAENAEGLRNLFRLSSLASIDGFYKKPRMDYDLISQHSAGIIATTGCASGEVQARLRLSQPAEALAAASDLRDLFGPANFYLELMDHGAGIERRTAAGLRDLGQRLGLPPLATNDAHYVTPDQAGAHEALLCVQTGKTLNDPDRFRFDGGGYHLKSPAEMRALWDDVAPGACDNTLAIAGRVSDYGDVFGYVNRMPIFDVPDGESQASWLRTQTWRGMGRRFPGGYSDAYRERAEYELRVIEDKGFPAYFLVVADIVRHAGEIGCAVGPGRGSATGSLVSYALGITGIDPIAHGLMFERMLNPERASMPDIDLDFDERYRGDMIRYVTEKYGSDRVSQIITFSTIKAKAAIKDATRVLAQPYALGDRLTKAFPVMQMGKDISLAAITDQRERRYGEAAGVRAVIAAEPAAQRILETARGLEDMIRQAGVHAAGIILSSEPLMDVLPVWQRDDGSTVTGFDFIECDAMGLLKMDFLGLRNLTVIEEAVANVRRNHDPSFRLDADRLEDPATYELLARGDTLGVFQLDGAPMRRLLQAMAPTEFADIVAVIALYRPGPMAANAHNDYADRKNGRKKRLPIHPELAEPLADILSETYDLIVYQEHVLAIAQKVAGYSLGSADMLRKAMGKKKPEVLAREFVAFQSGMQANGYSASAIKSLWDVLVPFAGYAFGKAHSAGYAVMSFWTAYLKANYPAEYMAALLTTVSDDKTKMGIYLGECRRRGIQVMQPDVNESAGSFTPIGDRIRFGLSAVRGIGDNVVAAIVRGRQSGPYADFGDFLSRLDASACKKSAVESLIKSGAFDSMGYTRRGLLAVYADAVDQYSAVKKQEASGQYDLYSMFDDDDSMVEIPDVPTVEWDKSVKLAFEREMLGMYVSDHPLFGMESALDAAADQSLGALTEGGIREGAVVTFAGVLSNVQSKVSKRGDPWASATIEDLTGSADILIFYNALNAAVRYLFEDAVVKVKCKVDRRDDAYRLMVLDLAPVAPVAEPEMLTIRLSSADCTPALVEEIRDAVSAYPGGTEVHIRLAAEGRSTLLRIAPRVERCPALTRALVGILGPGKVV